MSALADTLEGVVADVCTTARTESMFVVVVEASYQQGIRRGLRKT